MQSTEGKFSTRRIEKKNSKAGGHQVERSLVQHRVSIPLFHHLPPPPLIRLFRWEGKNYMMTKDDDHDHDVREREPFVMNSRFHTRRHHKSGDRVRLVV